MGLDSILLAMEQLFKEYGDLKYRPPVLLKKMVRAGHKGTKTGIGFFVMMKTETGCTERLITYEDSGD